MPNQWVRKRETIRHYDQTADTYDRQYAEEQNAKIAKALENLPKIDNAVTLDVGCGTGLLFHHIANYAKLIVGIDTSLRLLKRAKTRVFNNVMLIRADADHMPFRSNIFSFAFAFTLLQNMPDPHATLEEIRRITQKNALIAVTGLKKEFTQEAFTELLKDAKLEPLSTESDEKLKDYIAVCRKRS
jgi:ubiquinone/menaquinone biosynthesis C-methylase UbiE